MSAALRELRPVEIVGLYEDVLESFQVALLLKSHSHLYPYTWRCNCACIRRRC